MTKFLPLRGEQGNTWTHLAGAVFALSSIWMVWPAVHRGWAMAMGVIFFIAGMFLMFLSSTVYHWVHPGLAKRILRKCDHISIYVMIAASYTPICIGVVGGALGWTVFGILWGVALGGAVYKLTAMDRYPRLSLFLYLLMGWSFIFMAEPVCSRLPSRALCAILAEGLFYTSGTWFFAHDSKPYFHGVWHIFVLLGSVAHWLAILFILSE